MLSIESVLASLSSLGTQSVQSMSTTLLSASAFSPGSLNRGSQYDTSTFDGFQSSSPVSVMGSEVSSRNRLVPSRGNVISHETTLYF